MADWQMKTPVAFFIFNRPDTTARVFEEIRRARPPKLLLIADGPRLDHFGEAEKVVAARAIMEQVDWPCEVLRNYSQKNLGCKQRVSSGLNWVFETVEEAIILEDDCLPHPTFFRYCEELLENYRNDERVMHISGGNFQFGKKRGEASYFFSQYPHIWGWASWRRAWQYFDVELEQWDDIRKQELILSEFTVASERKFWKQRWDLTKTGIINTWDYQWMFACLTRRGFCITPNVNLISNIGYGSDATHTTFSTFIANLPVSGTEFPLIHPAKVICDNEADAYNRKMLFRLPGLFKRIFLRASRVFQKVIGT